ncbi:nucleotide exchange factor GrpE [Kineobactrum salinum]|uniref:Protein GrpE n=1 Tax=Kineobactrum salinum TaxID=2708301 RepID=A0A6C0U958_9GAMM|nr:nucleotide exchange factor GrpE [Kineobactrum salinum]
MDESTAADAAAAAEAVAADDAAAADSVAEGNGDSDSSPGELMAQLETDLQQARDAALRAHADAQNIKRRAEQDIEKAHKFALESFCKELLPVVDNLERALEVTSGHDGSIKPIVEGLELTLKSFQDALKKFHIEVVDPQGEPFDPQLHQAMSMVENGEVEPNTVIAVMQKGYTLHSRLVRPAMVMVSKAPAGQ